MHWRLLSLHFLSNNSVGGRLSQRPLVLWASGLWHYERTLYSRRPPKGTGVSIYLSIWRKFRPCNIWEIEFWFSLKFGINTRCIYFEFCDHTPYDYLRGSSSTKYPSISAKKNSHPITLSELCCKKINDKSFLKRPFHCVLKLNRLSVLTVTCSSFYEANKKILKKNWHFSAMGPWLFFPDHLFCPSQRKSRWTMSMDRIGFWYCLLGTSISMGSLTFFAWCKLICSWDEFNIQSQASDSRGTSSGSMV